MEKDKTERVVKQVLYRQSSIEMRLYPSVYHSSDDEEEKAQRSIDREAEHRKPRIVSMIAKSSPKSDRRNISSTPVPVSINTNQLNQKPIDQTDRAQGTLNLLEDMQKLPANKLEAPEYTVVMKNKSVEKPIEKTKQILPNRSEEIRRTNDQPEYSIVMKNKNLEKTIPSEKNTKADLTKEESNMPEYSIVMKNIDKTNQTEESTSEHSEKVSKEGKIELPEYSIIVKNTSDKNSEKTNQREKETISANAHLMSRTTNKVELPDYSIVMKNNSHKKSEKPNQSDKTTALSHLETNESELPEYSTVMKTNGNKNAETKNQSETQSAPENAVKVVETKHLPEYSIVTKNSEKASNESEKKSAIDHSPKGKDKKGAKVSFDIKQEKTDIKSQIEANAKTSNQDEINVSSAPIDNDTSKIKSVEKSEIPKVTIRQDSSENEYDLPSPTGEVVTLRKQQVKFDEDAEYAEINMPFQVFAPIKGTGAMTSVTNMASPARPKSPRSGNISTRGEKEESFWEKIGTLGRKKRIKEVQEVQDEGKYAIDSPGNPLAPELPPEDYTLDENEERSMITPQSYEDARLRELMGVLVEWINDELSPHRIIVKDLEDDLYDGQVLHKLIETLTNERLDVPEVTQSEEGQRQKLSIVLSTANRVLGLPRWTQQKWSVESIHSKNIISILHLLVALARHFRAPVRLPEQVTVQVVVVQMQNGVLSHRTVNEEITSTYDDIGQRHERDAFDTLFDHAPDKLQVVKKSLVTFVNKHLNKIGLEVNDIDTQFHDGVYLILLMGLLESFFVPLYSFSNTPNDFEQKVHNVNLAFELMQDCGLAKPKARPEDIVNLDLKSTLRVLYNLFTKYKSIS